MSITFLGTIFKDEPAALLSVDFEIGDNGVYSMGTQEFRVSLPMLGIEDGRTTLTDSELARAIEMIKDELGSAFKSVVLLA